MPLANTHYAAGAFARGKPGKARKKRFTGDSSAFKAWVRLMEAGPGIFIAMKTYSEANMRSNHFAKAARVKQQRLVVSVELFRRKFPKALPATVTLT